MLLYPTSFLLLCNITVTHASRCIQPIYACIVDCMHGNYQTKSRMCTRPFRPRPRRDPRRKGPRPRGDRDVGHFVRDETETLRVRDETETETFQLPRPWPRRVVKKIKHHKIKIGNGKSHSRLQWVSEVPWLEYYDICQLSVQRRSTLRRRSTAVHETRRSVDLMTLCGSRCLS